MNRDQLDQLYKQINDRKVAFFVAFFIVVTITYAFLYALDFYPEPVIEEKNIESTVVENSDDLSNESVKEVKKEVFATVSPLPNKIVFDSLDKEVEVLNPDSRAVVDLDEALLSGAVRHPDSATFSKDGNIFILAHSSYLPNVMNKNFQAFNGIQKLTWGDKVRLYSDDAEYIYRVEKVYEAKATEVFVPETPGEAKLTLATCNSFGSKDDRYIVEATLIGKNTL